MSTQITPHSATHPGIILKNELDSRGVSQKEFAQSIDMQTTMLNEIIKGKRSITADIALLLEKALDIPADFWVNLQSQCDLDEARIKEKNIQKIAYLEKWNVIKQYVPVPTFNKLGLLTNSLVDNIQKIWDIYEVNHLDDLIENFAKHRELVLYKKSEKLKNDQINIFAWSKLAMYMAKPMEVAAFSVANETELIGKLRKVFVGNTSVLEQTEALLTAYGIKFFILEKFDQTPVDGYSFLSGNNPAIVLTLRKKTLDNFAFALFHELGHVFRHFANETTRTFLNVEYANYSHECLLLETEADHYAKNTLIDHAVWMAFMRQNPAFRYGITEQSIRTLAANTQLHPSIILGRYCYETKNYAVRTKIERSYN
jgi:HTH-type transcriptional regulator/antitoxin HigA